MEEHIPNGEKPRGYSDDEEHEIGRDRMNLVHVAWSPGDATAVVKQGEKERTVSMHEPSQKTSRDLNHRTGDVLLHGNSDAEGDTEDHT